MNRWRCIIALLALMLPAEATAWWPAEGGSTRRANARQGQGTQPPYRTLWETRPVAGHAGLLEHGVTEAGNRVFGSTIDGTTFALNATTGKILWRRSLGRRMASTPAYHRGYVYVQAKRSSIGARLWKLSARTGRHRWSRRVGAKGSEGSPLIVRRKIFITTGGGRVMAFGLNGRRRWSRKTCQAWQAPTWTGRHIVAADYCGRVRAFTPRGRLRWRTHVSGAVYASLNSVRGRLYVHTKRGYLYALNARNGRKQWVRRTGTGIGYPECAATRYRVWCANGWGDNRLTAWTSRGRVLWIRRLPGRVMGAVVLTRRMLWVGTHDGRTGYNRRARRILGYNPVTGRRRVVMGSARYDPIAVGTRYRLYLVHYGKIEAIT